MQKQSQRALEKLARILRAKGVTLTVTALATGLSAEFAKAAPLTLAQSTTAAVLTGTAAYSTTGLTLMFAVKSKALIPLVVLLCALPLALQQVAISNAQTRIARLQAGPPATRTANSTTTKATVKTNPNNLSAWKDLARRIAFLEHVGGGSARERAALAAKIKDDAQREKIMAKLRPQLPATTRDGKYPPKPTMKISATITMLVIVASVTLGWHQRIALNQLHDVEQAMLAKATSLTAGAKSVGDSPTPGTRKSRPDREAEARSTAGDLIATLKEARKPVQDEPYRNLEKRVETVLDQTYQMNGSQLQALLEKLRNDPDMKPFPRLAAIRSAIMSLSDTDPAAAMAVLTEMAGQLGDSSTTFEHVIGKWASTDPLAALAWMRGNAATGEKSHDPRAFVIGLAAKDPKLAFQSLVEFKAYALVGDGEFEGAPDFNVAKQIARTARTLDERTAMLGILRELAANAGDDPDHVIRYTIDKAFYAMAEGLATYGYARASAWLESLDLRPGETAQLMRGLRIAEAKTKGEAAKWFEWMGGHLSPEEFKSTAIQRIHEWVTEDPQAVEKWLAQAPDGPAKRMAASAYADTIAARQAEHEQRPEPAPEPHPEP